MRFVAAHFLWTTLCLIHSHNLTTSQLHRRSSCNYFVARLAKRGFLFYDDPIMVSRRTFVQVHESSSRAPAGWTTRPAQQASEGSTWPSRRVSWVRRVLRASSWCASCCAIPTSSSRFATSNELAGTRGRRGVPRLRRRHRPRLRHARRPGARRVRARVPGRAAHGGARHGAASRGGRRDGHRPLGRLPPQGPCRLRAVVQHPPHGSRPAGPRGVRPARALPRRSGARRPRSRQRRARARRLRRLLSHGNLACSGARNPRAASRLQAAPLSSMPSRASRARARRPRRARTSASQTRTWRPTAWARTATRPRSSRSSASQGQGRLVFTPHLAPLNRRSALHGEHTARARRAR